MPCQKIFCRRKKHIWDWSRLWRRYFSKIMPRWLSPNAWRFLQTKNAVQQVCSSKTIFQQQKRQRGFFRTKKLHKWRMSCQQIFCRRKKHFWEWSRLGRRYFYKIIPRWLSPHAWRFLQTENAVQQVCSSKMIFQNQNRKRGFFRTKNLINVECRANKFFVEERNTFENEAD